MLGQRQVVMALMSWADKCFREILYWLQLPNSGETLKHIVPSHSRKARSGQNNYLGMVTSYMMNESEMGYRGSKSFLNNQKIIIIIQLLKSYKNVKEQRVGGRG